MGRDVAKRRLDLLLVQRGLTESRARAQWLIRQGRVMAAGRPCSRPGEWLPQDVPLEVSEPFPYVSRGGLKLAHALDTFDISVAGLVALDVGASTGGFTDCLLQRGVRQVYAVEVGWGQLHPRLDNDPRLYYMAETDIRGLKTLPGEAVADLAVVDVSFISLRLVLPAVLRLIRPDGAIIALVKPQFEVGPGVVNRRGVVRRRAERLRALREVLAFAEALRLGLAGLTVAPPDQERGNVEYLACWRRGVAGMPVGEAVDLVQE